EFLDVATTPATQPAEPIVLARLVEYAGKYPKSFALQQALLQWHVTKGELAEAATVAERMIASFPSNADPPRVATSLLRETKQWDRAAAAARTWAKRAVDD